MHNVIIQMYAFLFATVQTSGVCKLKHRKRANHAQTKLQNSTNAQAKSRTPNVQKTFWEQTTSCTKPFWIQKPEFTTALNPPILSIENPPKPFRKAGTLGVPPPRPSCWYVDKCVSTKAEPQGVERHVHFPIGRLRQIYKPKQDCMFRLPSLGKTTSHNFDCSVRLSSLGETTHQYQKTGVLIASLTGQLGRSHSQFSQRATMLQATDRLSRNVPNSLMPQGV